MKKKKGGGDGCEEGRMGLYAHRFVQQEEAKGKDVLPPSFFPFSLNHFSSFSKESRVDSEKRKNVHILKRK